MPAPISNIDRRSCSIELRTKERADGQRHIIGHAAVFDLLSVQIWGFREVIRRGAFASALTRSDVRALFNHNPDFVLGRTKSGTLKLSEDEKGLSVDITPPDTQVAKDLITSMERGDIDQMSFAFTVSEDRWYTDTETGIVIREITEIDQLYDVSPVTYPAYLETDVSARTQEALKEYRASIERVNQGNPLEAHQAALEVAARERELQLAEI